jgi:hypothetical protein
MCQSTHDFAKALLTRISSRLPDDFSGLGVVFYEQLDLLPFLQLGSTPNGIVQLPAHGIDDIAIMLAEISSRRSGYHDGFHFVDVANRRLTHVAQYLSPPLPRGFQDFSATGARHMTAILCSMIPGIAGVGLLTNSHELLFLESGEQKLRMSAQ